MSMLGMHACALVIEISMGDEALPVILGNLSKDASSLCRGSSCNMARGVRVEKQLNLA